MRAEVNRVEKHRKEKYFLLRVLKEGQMEHNRQVGVRAAAVMGDSVGSGGGGRLDGDSGVAASGLDQLQDLDGVPVSPPLLDHLALRRQVLRRPHRVLPAHLLERHDTRAGLFERRRVRLPGRVQRRSQHVAVRPARDLERGQILNGFLYIRSRVGTWSTSKKFWI